MTNCMCGQVEGMAAQRIPWAALSERRDPRQNAKRFDRGANSFHPSVDEYPPCRGVVKKTGLILSFCIHFVS